LIISTLTRLSLKERIEYVDTIMDEIIDSAERPLNGRLWWKKSEEIWQTLACCIEIANAVKSGDPANYSTSFPIHQDGSCNGLQHYAALGRDKEGAASVNLAPSEKPNDVYSTVLDIVEKKRKEEEDSPGRDGEIAKSLAGIVTRKVTYFLDKTKNKFEFYQIS
jgi:DNA-directed RNA polymerase, mitochondrial